MKPLLIVTLVLIANLTAFGQKGTNSISIGPQLGINITNEFLLGSEFPIGAGFYGKALYGVGNSGQIVFTLGYVFFQGSKNQFIDARINYRQIPILFGYRHHFDKFYVEPQIGFGNYSLSPIKNSNYSGASATDFTYSLGIGYSIKKIDLSLFSQTASHDGGNFSFIGIGVNYHLTISKKDK